MNDWRPIATAPKDGTLVLVRGLKSEIVATAKYDASYARPWCDWDWDDPLPYYEEPTHWMPLPDPPVVGCADQASMEPAPSLPERSA